MEGDRMGRRTVVLLIAAALIVGLVLGVVLARVLTPMSETEQACDEARAKILRAEVEDKDKTELATSVEKLCTTS